MTYFRKKIDEIPKSVEMVLNSEFSELELAVRNSTGKIAIAIGSGGSYVSARYFYKCRESIGNELTIVNTPLEFVVNNMDLSCIDVWIFSANANNPDTIATLNSAKKRGCKNIILVTTRANIENEFYEYKGILTICVISIADEKDGFLATHSLIGTVVALLLTFNKIIKFNGSTIECILNSVNNSFSITEEQNALEKFSGISTTDTIIAIIDPRLSPLGSLLETSIWESSLCNIQLTDFRNFAHGRHTWLNKNIENTIILTLSGNYTCEMNSFLFKSIPNQVRKINYEFGDCGRFENAIGLAKCMVWIDAIGQITGIDPAKPGVGDFGRKLYSDNSLIKLTNKIEIIK